jgi:hypothetical protein
MFVYDKTLLAGNFNNKEWSIFKLKVVQGRSLNATRISYEDIE